MGKQSEIFRQSEAKAWLKRNEHKLPPQEDPVLDIISRLKLSPLNVLEIGCSNGWRLDKLRKTYLCNCEGLDPCIEQPIRTAAGSYLVPGTADNIPLASPFGGKPYDTVIFGYCLYLCDPDDYFAIASQSNAVLQDGGYLIIYDFFTNTAYSREYVHRFGILSRKMDFAKLWLAHPFYSMITRDIIGQGDDRTSVAVLRKNVTTAFPVRK